jgi:hypothetical protein
MRAFVTWLYSGYVHDKTNAYGLCQLMVLAEFLDVSLLKDQVMYRFSQYFYYKRITAFIVNMIFELPVEPNLRNLCRDLVMATSPPDGTEIRWGPYDWDENEVQAWDALRRKGGDLGGARVQQQGGYVRKCFNTTEVIQYKVVKCKDLDYDLEVVDVQEWLDGKLAESKLVSASKQDRALSILDRRRDTSRYGAPI